MEREKKENGKGKGRRLKDKEDKEKGKGNGKISKREKSSLLEMFTEEDETLREYQQKKKESNRLYLLTAYFIEDRFKDEPLPEPPQVAKWRMKQRVRSEKEMKWEEVELTSHNNDR